MKHISLLLLLLFAFCQLFAQQRCNEAEYRSFFEDAKAYQAKGDYILAKSNYDAAIEYHCNAEQKQACEKAINDLFQTNIELLQKIKAANSSLAPAGRTSGRC